MPLIANRTAERDVREWLNSQGYYGRSAEVTHLELIAVAHPGWIQLFEFRGRAKSRESTEWSDLHGLLLDDERDRSHFFLASSPEEFDSQFALWSRDLAVRRSRERGAFEIGGILFVLLLLGLAAGFSFLRAL